MHVSDIGLRGAPDEMVLAAADEDSRILITADTDFGTLLALSRAAKPGVILLRRPGRRSAEQAGGASGGRGHSPAATQCFDLWLTRPGAPEP